jgi:Protein of unknown function (DUF2950)
MRQNMQGANRFRFPIFKIVVALLLSVMVVEPTLPQSPVQTTFATPEAAAAALVQAVRSGQKSQEFAILGPDLKTEIESLDTAEVAYDREAFLVAAKQEVKVERDPKNENLAIAYFGKNEWPFPAPLVKADGKWHFDGPAGVEEIRYRQIGKNELAAIDACNGYVDAQFDYFSSDWNDDGILQFAQRIISTPGKKDGLYWSNANNEPLSPLGPFFADAGINAGTGRKSFSGYYFKVLTRQGAAAKGGARNYVEDGRMILGFALVAWPADYGKTGVYTFIVDQLGVVYQKDLGADTAKTAEAMDQFNPDSGWQPVPSDDE